MEQITLTGSFVQSFDSGEQTFFIAQQNGRAGILSAGSWETVVPFCFDEILPCADHLLSAIRNGEKRLLRLVQEGSRLCPHLLPPLFSAEEDTVPMPA